jgi:hypothetical protein
LWDFYFKGGVMAKKKTSEIGKINEKTYYVLMVDCNDGNGEYDYLSSTYNRHDLVGMINDAIDTDGLNPDDLEIWTVTKTEHVEISTKVEVV